MKILFIGDIVGRPGRDILKEVLPRIKERDGIDFVITNGENAAGGFGLTPKVAEGLYSNGVDLITSGNHIWARKEVYEIISREPRLIRPANFPPEVPGKGWTVREAKGNKIGIINLEGQVYLSNLDSPFRCVDAIIERIKKETPVIVVDFHAEVTSEKIAMGWYLDGKVSALIGTHTHVQTADERILPAGTAYITDVGMTGAEDSVIGIKKEIALKRFLTQLPVRMEVASGDVVFSAVIIEIDEKTGKARSIRRLQEKV